MKVFFSLFLAKGICLAADCVVMAVAYLTAFILRFEFREPFWGWKQVAVSFAVVCVVQVLCLFLWGCYRLIWRFTGIADVPRFIGGVATATVLLILMRLLFPDLRWLRPPYSITFFNSFLVTGGLLAVRLLARGVQEGSFAWTALSGGFKHVLLVGAGVEGDLIVRELRRQNPRDRIPVGFLDDDPAKLNASILGVRVLGTIAQLPEVVRKRKVDEVVVSMTRAPRSVIRNVVKLCEQARIPARIVPGYYELIQGRTTVSQVRNIDITDLLGREEQAADGSGAITLLNRKIVLVTGAGGSIGSEIARQVLRAGPSLLLLVERSEFALYEIARELRSLNSSVPFIPVLGDIADEARMTALLSGYKPNLILHAAAYKHVPLMEENPSEALKNNVLATRALGELAIAHNVDRFVLISTDKAVRPISVMGASKRLCEIVLQDLNRRGKTRFSAVRFGNVLGSSGSVVPLFAEQIRRGGPVTVTHPDMKRYFMTISEAVSLVLEAAAIAEGGEVFVLDMGTPVRIVTLAEEMISLYGLRPYVDIPIVFTGVRPGEKLFEELDVSEKSAFKTGHTRIFKGRINEVPEEKVAEILSVCKRLAAGGGMEISGELQRLLRNEAAEDGATAPAKQEAAP
ncbi:MAG: polysaccharide biosynthesis protein [Kiritimatiellae bacterium]|nr:polysaccharide biosynthesis protein [Kiritimatiellia bacterium]